MASAIHVTSEAEAGDVERLGYGDRARVIPLGVDVGAHTFARRAADASRPLQLLFLSRLHEKKNVPLLLRALAAASGRGRNIELTIAGDGEPRYRAELESLSTSLGLGRSVRFVGHVEGIAKQTTFENADVFVLPSAHENFGLAVAEALAAGLPVIVTPGVALAHNVEQAGAGIVVDATQDALASAFEWAAVNPGAMIEMGERAWWLAQRELSWDTSCARVAELYAELASSGGRRVRRA
jgi:glycosyltransferase involved in cell wall biosynthesis